MPTMTSLPPAKRDAPPAKSLAGLSGGQWLALVLSAITARCLFAFGILGDMPPQSDALQYSNQARELLVTFPAERAYFWPPGLSYYLAGIYSLLGSSLLVSRAAMVLLGTLSTIMVVRVAWRAFSRPGVARVAGWIGALPWRGVRRLGILAVW